MSKLRCTCGHIIVDQTDNIPYKPTFIRDQDLDQYANYTDEIASFIDAIKKGQRSDWIKSKFSDKYPTDLPDSSVIFDVIISYNLDFESTIYQCEACGRIKLQVKDQNFFASFKPEDENYKDILKCFRDNKTAM
jgi:hypothetical protein